MPGARFVPYRPPPRYARPHARAAARKREFVELVAALLAQGFTPGEIALLLGYTVQRIRQVVVTFRLVRAPFATAADALAWLAQQCPDIGQRAEVFAKESAGFAGKGAPESHSGPNRAQPESEPNP